MILRSSHIIEEKKERTFEVFESKVSDYKFVSSELISYKDIKIEMTTLCELSASNLKTQSSSITYLALD